MFLSCWLFGLRFVSLVVLTLGAEAGQDQGGADPRAAFEKEMVDHPLEALTIARRAVGVLGKEETRLYRLAARQQEKILPSLGLGQVTEGSGCLAPATGPGAEPPGSSSAAGLPAKLLSSDALSPSNRKMGLRSAGKALAYFHLYEWTHRTASTCPLSIFRGALILRINFLSG